ncbi:hypothetical protein ACQUWX_26120, partial [Ralstonia pseudosolanacearum]
DKQYIWAASAMGRVFIGEEEPVGHASAALTQRMRSDTAPLRAPGQTGASHHSPSGIGGIAIRRIDHPL